MKRSKFTIYLHTSPSGKGYVGQSVDPIEVRWNKHVSAAKRNAGSPLLGAAIRKYGADSFRHEVLDVMATQQGADLVEALWIKQRRTRAPGGYNLAAGGNAPGYHHEETKVRIGKASSVRLQSMTPEQRAAHVKKGWSPARAKATAIRMTGSPAFKKMMNANKETWAGLDAAQRSARVKHQLSGLTPEQLSERARKSWKTRRRNKT